MGLMLDVCNKLEELAIRELSDYFNHIEKRAFASMFTTIANAEYPALDIVNNEGRYDVQSHTTAMKTVFVELLVSSEVFDKENYCVYGKYNNGDILNYGILQLSDMVEDMLNKYPLLEGVVDKRLIDETTFVDDTFENNNKAGFMAVRKYNLAYGKLIKVVKQKGTI